MPPDFIPASLLEIFKSIDSCPEGASLGRMPGRMEMAFLWCGETFIFQEQRRWESVVVPYLRRAAS